MPICADQRGLPGVEGGAVRGHLQQRQIHRRLRRPRCRRSCRRRRRGAARRPGSAARCRGRRRRRCRPMDPSTRRSASGSSMPSSGRGQAHRPAVEHLVDEQVDQRARPARRAGRRRGPGVAPRRGRARSARSSGVPPSPPGPGRRSARPSAASTDAWRSRRPGRVPSRTIAATAPRSAEHLLRLRSARWRVARPGCGVRAWRRGSPRWPAGPAASLRPGSVAGRGRPGTAMASSPRRASMLGPAGRPALVQSRVDADDLPDRPLARVGAGPFGEPHARACRGGAAPGRCCRSPRRPPWP